MDYLISRLISIISKEYLSIIQNLKTVIQMCSVIQVQRVVNLLKIYPPASEASRGVY